MNNKLTAAIASLSLALASCEQPEVDNSLPCNPKPGQTVIVREMDKVPPEIDVVGEDGDHICGLRG